MRFNPNSVPNLSMGAWRILAAVLAMLVMAEFFIHHHAYFGIEDKPGFYILWGFIASAGLVVLGVLLGKLLKRPEGYYQNNDESDNA